MKQTQCSMPIMGSTLHKTSQKTINGGKHVSDVYHVYTAN